MIKTIGILVGAQNELQLLLSAFNNTQSKMIAAHTIYECQTKNTKVIIIQTGLGKVNASLGANIVLNHYPIDLFINTGAAGSLSDIIKPGDLVIADQVLAHDYHAATFHSLFSDLAEPPTEYYTDDMTNLFLKTQSTMIKSTHLHKGLIISGDRFITNMKERLELLDRFPQALAVDMESSAIGCTCFCHGVPFIVIRAINNNCDQRTFSDYKQHFAKASRYASQLILNIINNPDKIF